MPLSEAQVKNKCLAGAGGRQCRYLERTYDYGSWKAVYHCQKLVPARKRAIDKKTNKFIVEERSRGRDPFLSWMMACGDGCGGYPYLPTVLQGYDVKKK